MWKRIPSRSLPLEETNHEGKYLFYTYVLWELEGVSSIELLQKIEQLFFCGLKLRSINYHGDLPLIIPRIISRVVNRTERLKVEALTQGLGGRPGEPPLQGRVRAGCDDCPQHGQQGGGPLPEHWRHQRCGEGQAGTSTAGGQSGVCAFARVRKNVVGGYVAEAEAGPLTGAEVRAATDDAVHLYGWLL